MLLLAIASAAILAKTDLIALELPVHQDQPYIQDYSIKYTVPDKNIQLSQVVSDRNGYIQVFSSKGLLRLRAGEFLFPGTLVADVQDI